MRHNRRATASRYRRENRTMNEPDYTLTITEQSGRFIVCEGGQEISKAFEDRREVTTARNYPAWLCRSDTNDTKSSVRDIRTIPMLFRIASVT
jgi:hypothetical protein